MAVYSVSYEFYSTVVADSADDAIKIAADKMVARYHENDGVLWFNIRKLGNNTEES